MSEKGSVFQKGGGGTNFEQAVQTVYLIGLALKCPAPCLGANEIIEVAFQTTSRGYETDDMLVKAQSSKAVYTLLFQIKHDIALTEKDGTFEEVLGAFWKDFNNTAIFDKSKDKLILVKGGLTKEERNHWKSLFNWANTHATETDFIKQVSRIKGKKEKLDIIQSILAKHNGNTSIADKVLWEFCKCMDVIEYDLLQEGSISRTYFLSLIKLSKSPESALNEQQIWDSLLSTASKHNKDGGNLTTQSIQDLPIYKEFSSKMAVENNQSVEKLKKESSIIIDSFKEQIGSKIHLDRADINEKITASLSNNPITIITGAPGAGKSAQAKLFFRQLSVAANIFTFRAEQFIKPHIVDVLSPYGIDLSVPDLFAQIALIPEKIIYLDSFEKLLEASNECAFKDLLAILTKHPDIKVIASCRQTAIILVAQKFGISKDRIGIVEIPPVNDEQLQEISEEFPELKAALENRTIKDLLRSPKYLDLAISALEKNGSDYSSVGYVQFKHHLWQSLVADETNQTDGMHLKRENAFMEIAVRRAKEMKLYHKPDGADPHALALLIKDEIILEEPGKRIYAPMHDILEDWALTRHITYIYDSTDDPSDFFSKLGAEPAIRRSFRIWTDELLLENNEKIFSLITEVLSATSIESYWKDELLTAVFRSEYSRLFFERLEKELASNNYTLLARCLHILQTCCKEFDHNLNFLLPTGSGWNEAIRFIEKHIGDLENLGLNILRFLSLWTYKVSIQIDTIPKDTLIATKVILFHYVDQLESGNKRWGDEAFQQYQDNIIELLFDLSPVAHSEIRDLFRKVKYANDKRSLLTEKFYEKLLKAALGGIGNSRLVKELPDLLIETANWYWKLEPPSANPPTTFGVPMTNGYLSDRECWGIEDNFQFYPPGIYKTFFHYLLKYHYEKAVQFLVDFLNYSIEFRTTAKCAKKMHLFELNLRQPDGNVKKIWADSHLFVAYRSFGYTDNLLESLLMSLDDFMLRIAARKTQESREIISYIYNYIYQNTNNIAPLGVLASVYMAYSDEVGINVLPLMYIKEIYYWDAERIMHESDTIRFTGMESKRDALKKNELAQMLHRNKFRGFRDYILVHQIGAGRFNKEIHTTIDQLKDELNPKDLSWKKILTEIDIRKQTIKEYNEEKDMTYLVPDYDDTIKEYMEEGKEEHENFNQELIQSHKLSDLFDGKGECNYQEWQNQYIKYKEKEEYKTWDRPVTLAVIGLRDFPSGLTEEGKKWSVDMIVQAARLIKDEQYPSSTFNMLEVSVTLCSFHYVLDHNTDPIINKEIKDILLKLLQSTNIDQHNNILTKYFKQTFFPTHQPLAKVLWRRLIQSGQLDTKNPVSSKPDIYYNDVVEAPIITSEINTSNYNTETLIRGLILIPADTNDEELQNFVIKMTELVLEDLKTGEHLVSYKKRKARSFAETDAHRLKYYFAELLTLAHSNYAKKILDTLLNKSFEAAITYRKNKDGQDILIYATQILKATIGSVELFLLDNQTQIYQNTIITNFWAVWEYLYQRVKLSGERIFTAELLLGIDWNVDSTKWVALDGKVHFYHQMVKDFGAWNTKAIVDVLSTVGSETMLPEGLSWIVEILKKGPTHSGALTTSSMERLITRLFHNHITEIKASKKFISEYLWLLDQLVELGSSEAYFIRENTITFKANR